MITPHWIENGQGDHGLVFLHGVSSGADGALDLLPRLALPGWRALAWDMPGYGASEPFEAGTSEGMGAYADALVELLDAAGHPTRVVSVPSFENFRAQSDAYKAEVIGTAKVKVGVEAALRLGWDEIIGSDGIFVGMTGFGASAPIEVLYEKFGITPAKIVEQVTAKLK
jgi:hypothetical protein